MLILSTSTPKTVSAIGIIDESGAIVYPLIGYAIGLGTYSSADFSNTAALKDLSNLVMVFSGNPIVRSIYVVRSASATLATRLKVLAGPIAYTTDTIPVTGTLWTSTEADWHVANQPSIETGQFSTLKNPSDTYPTIMTDYLSTDPTGSYTLTTPTGETVIRNEQVQQVSGVLSLNGNPVVGTVEFSFDGASVSNINTDIYGNYEIALPIDTIFDVTVSNKTGQAFSKILLNGYQTGKQGLVNHLDGDVAEADLT